MWRARLFFSFPGGWGGAIYSIYSGCLYCICRYQPLPIFILEDSITYQGLGEWE